MFCWHADRLVEGIVYVGRGVIVYIWERREGGIVYMGERRRGGVL